MQRCFNRTLFVFSLSLCSLILAASEVPAASEAAPLRAAVECTPRDGLPDFFAKLVAGRPVKIAYLGGSITAQEGWRVQSRVWFQKRYPSSAVTEVNAAIGGTGSDLGVYRVAQDALGAKPDLLFVEFAVNDHAADPAEIRRSMEGIVRQTWRTLPDTETCFVYTVTARSLADMQTGRTTRAQNAMEQVADHYGIPSVNFGVAIARLEHDGKLLMTSSLSPMARVSGEELNAAAPVPADAHGRILFSPDGTHPFPETGHVLYTQSLIRAMERIGPVGRPRAHTLGAPLMTDNLEGDKIIPLDPAALAAAGAIALDPASDKLAARFARQVPTLWKLAPGAALHLRFTGTHAAIYDLLGPDCGELEVTLDGISRTLKRIDGYSTYHRLSLWRIGDRLADKEHDVVIKVLPTVLDKRSIILETRRADLDTNPTNYIGTNWYVGALLVVGPSP